MSAAAGAGALAAAPAALAHDALVGSTPQDGAVLQTAPDEVVLSFSGDIQEVGSQVELGGPGGPVTTDPATIDGRDLVLDVPSDLPAGDYEVLYRATSSDGHPVSGAVDFTLAGPTPSATAPTSSPATTAPAAGAAATPAPSSSAGAADTRTNAPGFDDSGSPVVVPVVAATCVGLLLAGLAFASAAVKRRNEERHL